MSTAPDRPIAPDALSLADMARGRWRVDPDALTLVMNRRGMNGPMLARQAHISQSLVRNLRNGAYSITRTATLMIICDILGCAPELVATRVEDGAL